MAIRSAPCRSHHVGRGKGMARRPAPQHLDPNTVAKAYRVLKGTLDSAVKVGLIRQTAATLAAAGGTSLRALMTRVGCSGRCRRAPPPTRPRWPGCRDRRMPRRFGDESSASAGDRHDRSVADRKGHVAGTEADSDDPAEAADPPKPLQTKGSELWAWRVSNPRLLPCKGSALAN